MKFVVSFIVGAAVLYLYAAAHPVPDRLIPLWVDALVGAFILMLPASLVCRLLTKRIKGVTARFVDLAILLAVAGAYWMISMSLRGEAPKVHSPVMFWLRLTFTTWLTLFLPFGISVIVFEWIDSRRRNTPNKAPEPTAMSVTPPAAQEPRQP